VNHAEERLRSWRTPVAGRAGAEAALADRVADLTATATAAESGVRVAVGSSGAVTGLHLDERAMRLSGVELSEEILRTMRRAQAGLTDRVAQAVAETVGVDTETGRSVLDSFAQRFPAEPQAPPTSPVMPSPPPFPSFPSVPQQPVKSGQASHSS
jgi:hypothetical protein